MPSRSHRQSLEPRIDTLFRALRDTRDSFRAWRRTRLGLRGALLYLLAVPLAFAAIISLAQGEFSPALAAGSAFGLITTAGYLNRRGMLEELVASERRFTRSWYLPYKYFAVLLLTAGTSVAAYGAVGQGLLVSLSFGLLASAGFHLSYQLPRPQTVFTLPKRTAFDNPLHKALAQAEQRILAIEKAALHIPNQELEQRLQRIAHLGRAILDLILARPNERFRARKFLNVYLQGAEQVATRYARTHRLARGRELEQNFRNVLVEIESVFEQQLTQLAEHDIFDLDVQIEVLRQRLKREGIN